MTVRPAKLAWGCLLVLAAQCSAPADIILSDFTVSRPLKVMAIGDSITDDCSINGAWRRYLQPLLDTNGYSFVFVGRYASTPSPPVFTKVYHEGHCGAVIAPPGVFAVHGYSTTDSYLLKIVADALANTNNRPDLVLLKIGVNDIGRGRNPYQVATNDMPALLDLIFSYAPNAHIIVAKITSLQSAGASYGTYAQNVLIYNAALQAMINQRSAAGQNVYLADLFSAVDYGSMFQSDHIHPNGLGLAAIAREWFARIQAITRRSDLAVSTLIHGGESWRYDDTGRDLGTSWAQPAYDDSSWSNGLARLGYGDVAATTTVSYGPESTNKYPTTYFRHWFEAPPGMTINNLNFRLSRASGAVAWLNGRELFRANMPAGPITYTNLASSALNPFMANVYYPTNLEAADLPVGSNLVALELHQSSASFFLMSFDMELIGSGYPPPSLAIVPVGTNMVVSWPLANATGFKLFSTTNLHAAGEWGLALAQPQTNGAIVVVTQAPRATAEFFRLQKK